MNFTDAEFDAFRDDFLKATREVCEKYQLKVKNSRIIYGALDFDFKLTFERNDEGLPVERMKFESLCSYYGFAPDDYLSIISLKGSEYEFVGFQESAKKYKCLIRDIYTGKMTRITTQYMHKLLDEIIVPAYTEDYQVVPEPITPEKKMTSGQTKELADFTKESLNDVNRLSEKDLSMLRMKLGKSKRSQKDWAFIREILRGKVLFSYIPDVAHSFEHCIENIAVNAGYGMIFTDRELLVKRLQDLKITGEFTIPAVVTLDTYENIIEKANQTFIDLIFDLDENWNGCFLCYSSGTQELYENYIE